MRRDHSRLGLIGRTAGVVPRAATKVSTASGEWCWQRFLFGFLATRRVGDGLLSGLEGSNGQYYSALSGGLFLERGMAS